MQAARLFEKSSENNTQGVKAGSFLRNLTDMRKASIKAKSKLWAFDFGKTEMPFKTNAERQIKEAANSKKDPTRLTKRVPPIVAEIKRVEFNHP